MRRRRTATARQPQRRRQRHHHLAIGQLQSGLSLMNTNPSNAVANIQAIVAEAARAAAVGLSDLLGALGGFVDRLDQQLVMPAHAGIHFA
jgi:hypothetical protein